MRGAELIVLYAVVGLGSAIAITAYRRKLQVGLTDAALVLVAWPLYGPFLFARQGGATALPPRIACGPTAALAQRITEARDRVGQIESTLARSEFDVQAALTRQSDLEANGDTRAAAAAAARVRSIRQLVALRDRFARELTEVDELMRQLEVQSQLVALAGDHDDGTDALLAELTSRVEGLDMILEVDAPRQSTS